MKDQIVIDSAKGKYLFSNKKRYLDFSLSNGTMIFGHSEKSLIKKSISQIKKGTSYSNLNYYELKFKSLLSILFNEFKSFIFCNSGSEANIRAIRVSRALTQKKKIAIFSGSWHGSIDNLMYDLSEKKKIIPLSSGLINRNDIIVLPIDDEKKCKSILKKNKKNLSIVFFEPIQGSLPIEENLKVIKNIFKFCKSNKILTCFDEIICGGRVSTFTIYKRLKISPDIITLGKIFGGGFPIGIVGLNSEIEKKIKKLKKPVFFGGTFSGNIFVAQAGYNCVNEILKKRKNINNHFKKLNHFFKKKFLDEIKKNKFNLGLYCFESIFRIIFTNEKIFSKVERNKFDKNLVNTQNLRNFLISRRIFIAKSGAIFLSSLHTTKDLKYLIKSIIDFYKKTKIF